MKNILGIIISFTYIGVLMVSAKYFERFDKEASRKFIHILLSNWWLIAMAFFDNIVFALILPIAFVVINYISYKWGVIQVMERDEAKKDGLGTVYFAFSLIPLVVLSWGLTKNPLIGLVRIFHHGVRRWFCSNCRKDNEKQGIYCIWLQKNIRRLKCDVCGFTHYHIKCFSIFQYRILVCKIYCYICYSNDFRSNFCKRNG